MSLALLGLLCARPAHAQYPGGGYPGGYPGSGGGWVPSDAAGTPLPSNGRGTNSDGSANLMPSDKQPKKTNTYPIPKDAPDWWFGAYSPNDRLTGNPYYYYNGLFLNSSAGNTTRNNYSELLPFYDASNFSWDRVDTLPTPPDLIGSVHADNSDTLKAYFVWTGDPAHVPDHQSFLLRTSVSATASVSFGNGRATSGLSATGTGTLESDTVTATAGDAGSDSPAPHNKRVLVRATPNGKVIALSRSASVSVDTTNGLPYATWVPGDHDFYYCGPGNGYTSANASGNVSANANTDSRDVIITSFDIETSHHSGPLDSVTNSYPQDVRAGDGSIVTDSAVAPPSPPNQAGGSTSWTASPTLWAQATGFQSPTFAWSVSGPGSSSAGNSNHTVLSESFPVSTSDRALNKQSTVQVTVTDGDGATAANSFTVRWHYPKENAFLFASGTPLWQEAERKSVTAVGYHNFDAQGTFGYSTYKDFLPTASSELFNFGTNVPNPVWATVVAAAGWTLAQIQPAIYPGSANFNQCWDEPLSTGLPTPRDHALMDKYQMDPLLLVQYQHQIWNYEQYGQKGYLGPGQEAINHFTGSVRGAGAFSKLVNPPAGGG